MHPDVVEANGIGALITGDVSNRRGICTQEVRGSLEVFPRNTEQRIFHLVALGFSENDQYAGTQGRETLNSMRGAK